MAYPTENENDATNGSNSLNSMRHSSHGSPSHGQQQQHQHQQPHYYSGGYSSYGSTSPTSSLSSGSRHGSPASSRGRSNSPPLGLSVSLHTPRTSKYYGAGNTGGYGHSGLNSKSSHHNHHAANNNNNNHSKMSLGSSSQHSPSRYPYHTMPPTAQQLMMQEQSSAYSLDISGHSECSFESTSLNTSTHSTSSTGSSFIHSYKKRALPHHSQYLALDCEMVGTVTGKSLCARVVLVDWKGRTVYDSFVAPPKDEVVTDYRTFVSGVTQEDLVDAPDFDTVQKEVVEHLKDKIVVGHGLVNDMECLKIDHPWHLIRDTATYAPFQKREGELMLPRKLKDLVYEKLNGLVIQELGKAHDPSEDAIAALNLYKQHRPRWEACVSSTLQKQVQQQKRQERQIQQQQQVLARQQQYYYQLLLQQQQQEHQEQQQKQEQQRDAVSIAAAAAKAQAQARAAAILAQHHALPQQQQLQHGMIGNGSSHSLLSQHSLSHHSHHSVASYNHRTPSFHPAMATTAANMGILY